VHDVVFSRVLSFGGSGHRVILVAPTAIGNVPLMAFGVRRRRVDRSHGSRNRLQISLFDSAPSRRATGEIVPLPFPDNIPDLPEERSMHTCTTAGRRGTKPRHLC